MINLQLVVVYNLCTYVFIKCIDRIVWSNYTTLCILALVHIMGGGNRCSDDNCSDAGNETDNLIINELLTSIKHAIDTGKSANDIAPSFVLFYKDAVIKSAHEALASYLGTVETLNVKLPTRSRKIDKDDAKSTDVKNIVEVVRQIDWKGLNFPFVASDITQVCFVYGNLRDEVQMRSEMQRINSRLSNLEELLKAIPSLSNRIDTAVNAFKLTPPTTPNLGVPVVGSNFKTPGFSYKDKLTSNNANTADVDAQIKSVRIDNGAPSPQTPWKTVVTKKRSKKKVQCVVGQDESSGLLSSEVRPLKLFVTRCHAEMKKEQLHEYLSNNRELKVISIDKMKTRFDTYSSWKVVINRAENDKTDIMKPEKWPKNTIVRPFLQSRQHFRDHRNDHIRGPPILPNYIASSSLNNTNRMEPNVVAIDPPSPSWRT